MLEEVAGFRDQCSRVSFLGAMGSTLAVGFILEEMQSWLCFHYFILLHSMF